MSASCPVRTRIKFFKEEKVERKLSGKGEVLVKKDQKVAPDDVIAKVEVGGEPLIFDLPQLLRAKRPFPKNSLLKKIGEKVEKGERLASFKSLFLGKKTLIAPCSGLILEFKEDSGELIFQPETKEEVQMPGLFWGEVEKIKRDKVVLKTSGVDIFGFLGIKEAIGKILLCREQTSELSLFRENSLRGKILVFGESPGRAALEKLKIRGASGVICGGVHFRDFQSYQKGELPFLATEGCGKIKIGDDLLEIFQKYEGRDVLLEGEKKQVRIPLRKEELKSIKKTEAVKERELKLGDRVRLIGEPGPVGAQGVVIEIGKKKVVLESGFKVVLVKVKVDDEVLEVPSENLEIIEIPPLRG